MKNFIMLVTILVTVSFASCSNVKESSSKLIGSALSSAIVVAASCADTAAVKADVQKQVDSWFKIQAQTDKGLVGDLCKLAIEAVVPSLVGSQLKAEWKCSLSTISDASKLLSEMACKNIKI